MGKRIDYRYPPGYSKPGYNAICLGVNCDKRFYHGKTLDYLKITLCPDCFQKLKTAPKTKRQRLEAECNEVVYMVFNRMKDEELRI
jgi:hypothetical protein